MKTKLILLFLLVSNITFAQLEKKQNHTFSVNVNYLLDQWISKSDRQSIFEVESDHIVLVMYRNKKFRIGAGGVFRHEVVNGTFATNLWNQTHRGYVLQIGVQGVKNVWEKWDFIYGGDVLFQHRKFRSELTDDSGNFIAAGDDVWSEIKRNTIGLNGFMGVQFYVTKQLSFSTEFSLRLNRTYNSFDEGDAVFFNNPLFSQVSNINQRENINLAAPLTLFLNFQF